jgi:hypothetical protein
MHRWRINDLARLMVGIAALLWAVTRWSLGRSCFGFESPYWDLGLLPILALLVVAAGRSEQGPRRRFQIGFEVCGALAAVVYTISCLRNARWNPVSVLQPYQTGFQLMPEMKSSVWNLNPWGAFVDTVILVSIPVLPAVLSGVAASARITLRRIMVTTAIIALIFAGFIQTARRARHNDRMGLYHREQVVGVLYWRLDGKFEPLPRDRNGKAVSLKQQGLDRWHEAMAQRYWHAPYFPWSATVKESPPPGE